MMISRSGGPVIGLLQAVVEPIDAGLLQHFSLLSFSFLCCKDFKLHAAQNISESRSISNEVLRAHAWPVHLLQPLLKLLRLGLRAFQVLNPCFEFSICLGAQVCSETILHSRSSFMQATKVRQIYLCLTCPQVEA